MLPLPPPLCTVVVSDRLSINCESGGKEFPLPPPFNAPNAAVATGAIEGPNATAAMLANADTPRTDPLPIETALPMDVVDTPKIDAFGKSAGISCPLPAMVAKNKFMKVLVRFQELFLPPPEGISAIGIMERNPFVWKSL